MEYLPDMPEFGFSWQYQVSLESAYSSFACIPFNTYRTRLNSIARVLDEFNGRGLTVVSHKFVGTRHNFTVTLNTSPIAVHQSQAIIRKIVDATIGSMDLVEKEPTLSLLDTEVIKLTAQGPHLVDQISLHNDLRNIHPPIAYPSLVDLQHIHNESTLVQRQVDVESIPLTSWRESVLYQYFRDGRRSRDTPSLIWRAHDEETNLEDVMQAAAVLEISFFVRPAGERVSCPECGYNSTDEGSPYIFGWIRCTVCRKLFWAAVFPLHRTASGGRLIDDDRYTKETSIADTTTPHVTADFVIVAHQGQAHPIPYAMARSETILLFGDITIHSTFARSRSSSVHSVRSQWSIISPNSTSASCSFCMVEHDASDDDNYSVRSLTSEPPSPGVGPGLCQCPGGACCSAEHIKRLVEDALGSGQGPVFIGCSFTVINGDIFNGPISHANVGGYKNNNRVHNVTQLNSQVSTIPVPRLNHFARTVANFMRG